MVWQEWQVAGWQMEGMALATRLCAVLDVSKSSPGTQKRDTLSRFIFVSAKSPGKRYIVIYMYIYIFIYIYVCMYIYSVFLIVEKVYVTDIHIYVIIFIQNSAGIIIVQC